MDSTEYIHSVMVINREKYPKYSILSITGELEIYTLHFLWYFKGQVQYDFFMNIFVIFKPNLLSLVSVSKNIS